MSLIARGPCGRLFVKGSEEMPFIRVLSRVAIALSVVLPVPAFAQSGTSTIAGLVRDGGKLAIPGAQVKVVNEETGVAVDTTTNEEGLYRVGALVPGTYRVEVLLDGFEPAVRRPIGLQVGQTLAVDVTLDI